MFIVCNTCQRHVRADASHCPFCAKRAQRKGLLSVGAMAVASLGIAACGPSEPPATAPTVQASPDADPPETNLSQEDAPAEQPLATPEPEPEPPAEEPEAKPEEPDTVPFDRPMVARYGIAPLPATTAKPPPPQKPQRPVARYGLAPQ